MNKFAYCLLLIELFLLNSMYAHAEQPVIIESTDYAISGVPDAMYTIAQARVDKERDKPYGLLCFVSDRETSEKEYSLIRHLFKRFDYNIPFKYYAIHIKTDEVKMRSQLIEAAAKDADKRLNINPDLVFVVAIGDEGISGYNLATQKETVFTGTVVVESDFDAKLFDLKNAKGRNFYIVHSKVNEYVPYDRAFEVVQALLDVEANVAIEQLKNGLDWQSEKTWSEISIAISQLAHAQEKLNEYRIYRNPYRDHLVNYKGDPDLHKAMLHDAESTGGNRVLANRQLAEKYYLKYLERETDTAQRAYVYTQLGILYTTNIQTEKGEESNDEIAERYLKLAIKEEPERINMVMLRARNHQIGHSLSYDERFEKKLEIYKWLISFTKESIREKWMKPKGTSGPSDRKYNAFIRNFPGLVSTSMVNMVSSIGSTSEPEKNLQRIVDEVPNTPAAEYARRYLEFLKTPDDRPKRPWKRFRQFHPPADLPEYVIPETRADIPNVLEDLTPEGMYEVDPMLRLAFDAYNDEEKHDEAIRLFNKYLELNPDTPFKAEVYFRLGYLHQGDRNYNENHEDLQVKYYQKAHEIWGNKISYTHMVAWRTLVNKSDSFAYQKAYFDWLMSIKRGELGAKDWYRIRNIQETFNGRHPRISENDFEHIHDFFMKANLNNFLSSGGNNFYSWSKDNEAHLAVLAESYPEEEIGQLAKARLEKMKNKE
ncbi:hypothetical protein JD969_14200 [Planctomycetota bacterium]|nr:hypothetical protein JD969_14200 [Planctomycetota bacterium]